MGRCVHERTFDVLSMIAQNRHKSSYFNIICKCSLNNTTGNILMERLVSKGLIAYDNGLLIVTEKGRKFMTEYKSLDETCKS